MVKNPKRLLAQTLPHRAEGRALIVLTGRCGCPRWVGGGDRQTGGVDLGTVTGEYFDCTCDLIRLTKRWLSEQGELSLRLPRGTGTVRGRQFCTCRYVAVHDDH